MQFASARTPVPLTLPAHASLLTGALPAAHGVHVNGQVLPADVPTLATVLRAAGYRTGGFVGAYVLDRRFGLARGFDTYDDRVPRDPQASDRLEAERPADQVVDAALAWLDAAPRHRGAVLPVGAPLRSARAVRPAARRSWRARARARTTPRWPMPARRPDGCSSVSRRAVSPAPRWSCSPAITAKGSASTASRPTGCWPTTRRCRVPLVVAAPGAAARRIAAPVSLADVAPSVLKLAGVTGTLVAGASTRDLFAAADAGEVYAETEYPAAAGWSPLSVLANARWKLIRASTPELYDLRADPAEAINLAAANRREVQAMAGRLGAARGTERLPRQCGRRARRRGQAAGARLRRRRDADGRQRRGAEPGRGDRRLGTLRAGAVGAGPRRRTRRRCRSRATWRRASPPARCSSPPTPARSSTPGSRPAAAAVLRSAVERRPDDPSLFHDLSVAARAAGDAAEALRAEQAALALDASNPQALNGVGLLHVEAGRSREAVAAFEQATAADPSNATYWSNLGNARRALGEARAAEAAYRRALDVQPAHADAANGLGVLLVQRGDAAQAVAWFERALAAAPDFHEARLNLGIAYQESGQRAQAVAAYQQVLREAPRQATRERAAAAELLRSLR